MENVYFYNLVEVIILKDVWYLFNEDFYVGKFIYDEEKDEFFSIIESEGELTEQAIDRLKLNQGSDMIKFSLEERCFPPNRIDARELLRELGLIEYDRWEILKRINLCNVNDNLWISKVKDGSLFFKINPRGLVFDQLKNNNG